jgi:hypothetical protein
METSINQKSVEDFLRGNPAVLKSIGKTFKKKLYNDDVLNDIQDKLKGKKEAIIEIPADRYDVLEKLGKIKFEKVNDNKNIIARKHWTQIDTDKVIARTEKMKKTKEENKRLKEIQDLKDLGSKYILSKEPPQVVKEPEIVPVPVLMKKVILVAPKKQPKKEKIVEPEPDSDFPATETESENTDAIEAKIMKKIQRRKREQKSILVNDTDNDEVVPSIRPRSAVKFNAFRN